ncbi:hypothetical protein L3X38_026822 [Prunus dulcis]|uniref:Uncharacterized protein n=1 Tax=Prunus dulcis TaxID=3755 RepID=A0AAD4YZP6_PRUDU|nr:hypothetical protein L3X38_026822 [Prunus dulcis]
MIREILRTRDNQEIALGQKCKFSTVPKCRTTRWLRMGVHSDNPSSEKLNTSAQDSYPRCEVMRSWANYMSPEFCENVRLRLTKCPMSLVRNAAQADKVSPESC